jgi:hypothetical protein
VSFTPIKFFYTPPPTIPSQSVLAPENTIVSVPTATSSEFGSAAAAASNAAVLVVRVNNLSATAQYLVSVIQSLVKNLGVTFDLSANPDLGRALAQIYNTTSPPSSMDMTMYTTLLEADINFLQFDLLNPPVTSSVQIQPLQRANIGLVTKSFENALLSTGVYDQTSPILMRSLMGDQLVFNSLSNALQTYPILSVPQLSPVQLASSQAPSDTSTRALNGSTIDVSSTLTDTLNGLLDQWQSSYAGIYQVLASPDPTETALPSIVATLSTQPTSDLTRLLTMMQNLVSFQQQAQLQTNHDSVDNFTIPRLLSDVFSFTSNLDFVNQVAVTPSSGFEGPLGSLMSQMASINPGSILDVGLTGSVAQAAGGYNPPTPTAAQQSALSGLPEGLQIMGANISWAQSENARQNNFIQQCLQRLSIRRITNQGNQTEFLTSLKSISSTIGIIQSLLSISNNNPQPVGSISSLNPNPVTPVQGLQSFGTLINSLSSQSGSSYSLDGSTLTITPPTIPTASSNVQSVLAAGGVNQITTQSLQIPINLGV